MPFEATVKETGEKITVYKMNSGKYYDYDKMGVHEIAQSKTGKKEFRPDELIIGKVIES
jgi:hypothetical protein